MTLSNIIYFDVCCEMSILSPCRCTFVIYFSDFLANSREKTAFCRPDKREYRIPRLPVWKITREYGFLFRDTCNRGRCEPANLRTILFAYYYYSLSQAHATLSPHRQHQQLYRRVLYNCCTDCCTNGTAALLHCVVEQPCCVGCKPLVFATGCSEFGTSHRHCDCSSREIRVLARRH